MRPSYRTMPVIPGMIASGRHLGRLLLPVLASVVLVQGVVRAAGTDPSLRERALQVGRQVLVSVGHRIASPVQLQVMGDSAEAVTGGFSEALSEAGFTPLLSELTGTSGTVILVRRNAGGIDGAAGLEVRVEQWPERSVLYSRLWLAGAGEVSEGSDGLIERLLVPVTVGAAAALIVYLFFTVRS